MKKVSIPAKLFSLTSACLCLILFLAACGGGGGAGGMSIPDSEYTTHNSSGWGGGSPGGNSSSGSNNGIIIGSTPLNVISYTYNGQTYTSVDALRSAIAETAPEAQFTISFTCTDASNNTETRTARITKTVSGNNTEILIEHQYKATVTINGTEFSIPFYKNDGVSLADIAAQIGNETVGSGSDEVIFELQKLKIGGAEYGLSGSLPVSASGDVTLNGADIHGVYPKWGISSSGRIEFSSSLTNGETLAINAQNIHTINIPTDRQVNLNLSSATFQDNKIPSDFIPNNPTQKNNLTGIVLPNGITEISDNAFSPCGNLTSITIPGTVQKIDWSAFDGCSSLSSVTFEEPSQLQTIEDSAFSHTAVSSITLPQGVQTIGANAFDQCGDLTSLVIPNSVATIGQNAFSNSGLSSLTIPDSVTSINQSAFSNCNNLTSVTINGNPTLGKDAFKNSTAGSVMEVTFNGMPYWESTGTANSPFGSDFKAILKSGTPSAIEYSSSLKDIVFDFNGNVDNTVYSSGFSNWTNLERIEACSGIANIAPNAFENFSNLQTVIIQNGVIQSEAFKDCDGLATLSLGEGVTQLSNNAFKGCLILQEVELPASAVNIQNTVFEGCINLTLTMKAFPTNGGTGRFSGITGDFTLIFKPVNEQMEIKSIMDNLTSVTGLGNFFGDSSGYPGGNLTIVFDTSDGGTFKINGGTFSSAYFPSTALFQFVQNNFSDGNVFLFETGSCFAANAHGTFLGLNLLWNTSTKNWTVDL